MLSKNTNTAGELPRCHCLPRTSSDPLSHGVSNHHPLSVPSAASVGDYSFAAAKKSRELRVLFVEDEPCDVELVLRSLHDSGLQPGWEVAQNADEFTTALRKNSYDVILADYKLPQWNGMECVEILRREGLDVPVIVVSGSLGEQTAVECIKQGAADYVLKDKLARLPESIRRAIREKQLREEHNQAQTALARSNQDLEQFAYVASHDLQEPLRMVATYTQLLAERYRGKLDDKADKYIQYAVDGALRMQSLIQDLLTFSRIGRQDDSPQETDCNAVMKVVLDNLQSAIQDSSAQISHDDLPTIVADCSQLIQLFQNLIGNGIKFRSSKPPRVHVSATRKDKEWIFSVADNGIGISPEHAESIFIIFRRLHTRAEYPGSGIGLAICRKIVERLGGMIWVESQLGEGATFKFTLPLDGHQLDNTQP
jgi:signal transduction histidine kinase